MSDIIKDLADSYDDNVHYPRHLGLFPIPEYPELEARRGMWSAALDTILTTLRYLAPATLLTLFWGQQSFLFKLLKSIDSAFRAIVFSSEEQKEEVLQWVSEAGAVQVENLNTVWRHGWILCGVLDTALPGACAGHPPTRLNLKHALAIADHYLGVEPVFSRQELETCDSLSRHQEWKLATYLDRIRQALSKLTPPVSKPTSQRTSPETAQFTLDYVARGSGLIAAQVNNAMHFKIYPTSQQSLDPGDINILIRGPKDTYGMTTVPPILGKAQLIRQKLLGLQSKPHFTENALPLTQGATYMRSFGKNDMNKTYHIPKTMYDIDIQVETHTEHTRITYIVALEGRYEVSITSRGQNIVGSPFSMTASYNIIGILEKDNNCLEHGEEIDIVDVKTDRKVVLRIVDFVTEKMLLKENGALEKITDDEAQILMSTDNIMSGEYTEIDTRACSVSSVASDDLQVKPEKFNKAASKIVQMNRVCRIINSLLEEKKIKQKLHRPRSQQDIPDIVNSTFSDTNINPFIVSDKRNKFIIPENISVSLRTEKEKEHYDTGIMPQNTNIDDKDMFNTKTEYNSLDSLDKFESIQEQIEDDVLRDRPNSSNNPFLNDIHEQNFVIEKDLGSFVKTEYETNKSDNEETEGAIKILVENLDGTPSPTNTNPFFEPDIINMERPKTPVLKIITGEVQSRSDSVYLNPRADSLSDEMLSNEFINPFFLHHLQSDPNETLTITDFIIGAPVSLPPIVRAPSPEPAMESLMITDNHKTEYETKTKVRERVIERNDEETSSIFSTPLHTISKLKESKKNNEISYSSSTFYSLDSNISNTDEVEIVSLSNVSDVQDPSQLLQGVITPKKDMWDSAYVSIDDSNSSPESNYSDANPTNETINKQKFSLSDTSYDYAKMGPAEREIWKTCNELSDTNIQEDIKTKWDVKRPIFTPILEESDRSMSALKDITRSDTVSTNEHEAVTVAFAELNDMYHDFFPNDKNDLLDINVNQTKRQLHVALTGKDKNVDSASAASDVKRHAEKFEGKISEVQANVTESVSVSQTLHKENGQYEENNNNEIQFGDQSNTNIVLEKKQYWDNRIREIEAKSSEEGSALQKRRRLSARHLRQNDSLTKQRGQQFASNIQHKLEVKTIEVVNRKSPIPHDSPEQIPTDVKMVEKWKKYWDDKLETGTDETETSYFKPKSQNNKSKSKSAKQITNSSDDLIEVYNEQLDENKKASVPVKQELPEEVFKAFETSPKRFFGTSRKQILNKIDTFLGKPSTADESSPELSGANTEYDSGLVSSRISMFHNISQTEKSQPQWTRRKFHSMHNIFQRKDSERSMGSFNEKVEENPKAKLSSKSKTFDFQDPRDQEDSVNISLKDKRARMLQNINNRSFDESSPKKPLNWNTAVAKDNNVKKTIKEYNRHSNQPQKQIYSTFLRKSSVSKSEMDIFTKITNKPVEDDLDKYKSCEELPKINVKNFINLYEGVSKTDVKAPVIPTNRIRGREVRKSNSSSFTGAANTHLYNKRNKSTSETDESSPDLTQSSDNYWNKDPENISTSSCEPKSLDSMDIEIVTTNNLEKQTTYLSLSDIEVEIVENADDVTPLQANDESKDTSATDYKSRFKMAKEFFVSLEELREIKKPKKMNECELLLKNISTESLENERPQKRVKKNIKSHSMPSSEISKIWTQMQEGQENSDNKLVKISEKFNVEDLFNDVMEGKLSRQGSLRGIPHKKAVLEAFRSMENLTDNTFNSYEIATSQLNDFAKENQIKNAQTHLTEYPYLPTTDPSKYHSRLDARAIGLVSLKELQNRKPRRNSVPDLRLNTSFTVEL